MRGRYDNNSVCFFTNTGRFHFAIHLYYNRSQEMSKCGKNKKLAHLGIAECVSDVLEMSKICSALSNMAVELCG